MECEIPEFYNWKELTAKKKYQCCECHAPINIGEKHFYATGKWDGKISSFRQHLLCEEACEFIRDNINFECISFGGLFEWFDGEDKLKSSKNHPNSKKIRTMIAQILKRKFGKNNP